MDAWKTKFPTSKRGTFHRGSYSARLDYIFISHHLLQSVSTLKILPEPLSDHCLLETHINAKSFKRGPGYWRFNNYWLSDADFKEEMKAVIRLAREQDMSNPHLQWEWMKYKIREFTISYTVNRAREQRAWITKAEKRLSLLTEQHDLSDSQDVITEVASLKRELAEVQQHAANRSIFKSKANWTQLGERPTAYFLGLEKRQYKEKTLTSIKDENGHVLTNNTNILDYEKRYYSYIYKEDTATLESLDNLPIPNDEIPQVTEAHRKMNDLPFTPRDFHEALKQLNKNKSPGSDGITPEFYIAFWDQLHDLFFETFMYSLNEGHLSEGQHVGIVTLIPKKSQDRQQLSNWRPITLLNTDFKIFSKALANKIQSCITDVIHNDQTGFIKRRSITTNLTNIQLVIDQVHASDSHGILLAVDYEKAFDTIRWALIQKVLNLFGFGELIPKAVTLLFKDIKTCILNSGYSSDFFFPQRGIRQGCCCSPSLFTIAVELLAIMVRRNLAVRGIQVAGREMKISQYADDSTFFVKTISALDALLELLTTFSTFSGLRINYKKSHLLLLGHHLHPPVQYRGIQVKDTVKILGIIFKDRMREEEQYLLNFVQS